MTGHHRLVAPPCRTAPELRQLSLINAKLLCRSARHRPRWRRPPTLPETDPPVRPRASHAQLIRTRVAGCNWASRPRGVNVAAALQVLFPLSGISGSAACQLIPLTCAQHPDTPKVRLLKGPYPRPGEARPQHLAPLRLICCGRDRSHRGAFGLLPATSPRFCAPVRTEGRLLTRTSATRKARRDKQPSRWRPRRS